MSQKIVFTPVQIGRRGEDIALQIEAAILEEKILPGERLPSERELQIQFQTGRGVVREAIRALKQKGLVDIRKGAKGGAYVKHIDVANVSESLALFLKQQHIEPDHIAEFRESIDRVITILAIARADVAAKEELVAETEKLMKIVNQEEPDQESIARQDRILNIRLAQMSNNPVFAWIMEALQQGFSSHDYALYDEPAYRQKTAANWQKTALHIARNDPMKALSSIAAHYDLLRSCVAEQKQQSAAVSDENNGSR
jgi:GntR family transcriptional regulator, transcriptional repressor for pyruvate dehydrogenase complex